MIVALVFLMVAVAGLITAFALLCFASAVIPRFGSSNPTPGMDVAVGTVCLCIAMALVFFAGRLL